MIWPLNPAYASKEPHNESGCKGSEFFPWPEEARLLSFNKKWWGPFTSAAFF